jgi:hypothetical protein
MISQIKNIFINIFFKNLLINFYILISINFFFIYFYQQSKWYNIIFVLLISSLSVYLFKNQHKEYESIKNVFNYRLWIILLIIFINSLNFFITFDVKDLLSLFLIISASFFSYQIYKHQIYIFFYINFVFFFITLLSVLAYILSLETSLTAHPLRISYLYVFFGHEVVSRAKGIFWSPQYYTLFVSIYLLTIIFGYGFKNFFLKYASLILCIFSIFISETRTSMYSIFIVCIFLIFVINSKKFKFYDHCIDNKILYASTSSLFFIIMLTILPVFFFNINVDQFLSGRAELLSSASEIVNYSHILSGRAELLSSASEIVNHSHNIFFDLLSGFYHPIYFILVIYLIFCVIFSLIKKNLFLFAFLFFFLTASMNDLVWRPDRADLITVFLIFLCLTQEKKKITTPSA